MRELRCKRKIFLPDSEKKRNRKNSKMKLTNLMRISLIN